MLPILQLGPLSIQTDGLVLLLALWIGLGQAEKTARRSGQDANLIYNLALVALIAGVIGARLFYAGRNLPAFIASPLGIFTLSPVMLDESGGVLVAVLAGWIYGQRKGLPMWPTLDTLTPALAILGIGLGLAHLASGDGFGAPTSLPWGIEMWGEKRHPAQLYEITAALIIAIVAWPHQTNAVPGQRFLIFMALSAFARVFLEAFRGDSALLVGSVRTVQVAAWFVLAAALWGMQTLRRAVQPPVDPT